jgi:hypothetical protein
MLMIGALGAAVFYAFDIPGLMESGRFDARLPAQMTRDFGTTAWPSLMRAMAVGGIFLFTVIAQTLFMMLRRRHGGIHMVRSLLGSALMVAAPIVLVSEPPIAMPAPAVSAPSVSAPNLTITATAPSRPADPGWSIFESYSRRITPPSAFRAAVVFAAGLVLVIWPAKKERLQPKAEVQHV